VKFFFKDIFVVEKPAEVAKSLFRSITRLINIYNRFLVVYRLANLNQPSSEATGIPFAVEFFASVLRK
jgi:Ni/Fe-hydrogenase subunit HybB-like protein